MAVVCPDARILGLKLNDNMPKTSHEVRVSAERILLINYSAPVPGAGALG
jgi:hypothetical protein